MNLTKEQIDHLRNAQHFAAKACVEFTLAGLPPTTFSTSTEIGLRLDAARAALADTVRRYTERA
jgi:hypothetical protein